MAEQITLTTPIDPPRTIFRIVLLSLDWMNAHIVIHLRDWDGTKFGDRLVTANYTGAEALSLMIALNKANLATQSLHQRMMTKLLADGKIPAGTPSGAPD